MNPTLSSDSTIAVPAATGAGSTGTPVSDAAIAAPSAAASAQAPVPGIATTGSSNVGAPAASSAAQAPTPGVAASAPVAAVPATASAAAPVPAVADNETVSAVKAAASASAPTPGVAAIHEVPMGMDKSGASQTIGANVWTLLTTWVVRSGYPDTVISSNALRPTAGDYYFDAKVAINTARQLRARIVRNGSEVLATVDSGTSVTSVTVSTASPVTISSGDLITVEANPTAGRDVISGASNTYLTATPA
ncbi:hypothetical protein [Rhodococcus sp. UNC363MFTsu5.1]|uniref:hypothetical protein n=1 Tax=Rhodococcus sp. UNC363MFTsu5.1 TaxID=1449069 RepID=UPI0012DFB755|nr:hypothetical protein [Rhodococcus sp. UNC363MFTsu5.1]